MNVIPFFKKAYIKLNNIYSAICNEQKIRSYITNGRKPWSLGYDEYKTKFLQETLINISIINMFQENRNFHSNYGQFLDERVVEYPWLISRLNKLAGKVLDAGSALNHEYILQHEKIKRKELCIVTLEPEQNCYWNKKVSYLFHDIRELPFIDDYFDEVISISTLEHIGMDNTLYSSDEAYSEHKIYSFLDAITELKRVVKPGGKVYVTVPYGIYTNFSWYQQFDRNLIDKLIAHFSPSKFVETYFCYENDGWNISSKEHCDKFKGFNIHDTKYKNADSNKDYDPDFAACSRAIAALELYK